MVILRFALFFLASIFGIHAQRHNRRIQPHQPVHDELYILINNAEVHNCKGVENKIVIEKEDIVIADGNGQKVHYIRAPGEYKIQFNKITLLEPLPHISGEISALLQVPIVEGPLGIRFDFPYPVIPETSLFKQRCDSESGVIQRLIGGKERAFWYCDLCRTSAIVEQQLNRGHKYLPELGRRKNELEFTRICQRLDQKTYQISRTVKLPGRRELERQVRQKFGGVGTEIKRRFDKGRGKFEVQLHLLSSKNPTQRAEDFYKTTPKCRCCNPHHRSGDISCIIGRFITCSAEDCKSQHAQQCLASEQMAACYTTVFNYRVTTNYAEVTQFLALKGIGDHLRPKPARPRRPPPPAPRPPSPPKPQQPPPRPRPRPVTPIRIKAVPSIEVPGGGIRKSGGSVGDVKTNCIKAMPRRFARLKKYCDKFWNRNFCCSRCEGVCQ